MEKKDTTPTYEAPSFRCPHCQEFSQQDWVSMRRVDAPGTDTALGRSQCHLCDARAYWINKRMVWPALRIGAPATDDLEGIQLELYEEARTVAPFSPRAAVGLLRLLVELLVKELEGSPGRKTFDERIAVLAKRGDLNNRIINAMDAVRLTGNRAVHAGMIEVEDKGALDVADLLFTIVNMIIENTRTLPGRVESLKGDYVRNPKPVKKTPARKTPPTRNRNPRSSRAPL